MKGIAMPLPGFFRFKILLFFIFVFMAFAQDGGNAGLAVLKMPVSSWQSGIGGAMSVGRDAGWTNQSAAAFNGNVSVMINYEEWFEDVYSSSLGAHFPAGDFVITTQLFLNQVSGLEVRTAATEAPLAVTDAHILYGKLGAGYRVNENLAMGLSLKYIGERIFSENSQGYAADLSAYYKFAEMPVELSLLLANLGKMGNLRNEATDLPFCFALGGKYKMIFAAGQIGVNLISEVRKSISSETKISLGSEILLLDMVAFQLGYLFNDELTGFTAGSHVYWEKMRFGMAWVPAASDFGDHLSFSLAVSF
jgi:hypothetical protein